MSECRGSAIDGQTRGNQEEELMVALRSIRPQEVLAAEGPMLGGNLHVGANRIRCAEPTWMVLQVVHWDRHPLC